jgi:hypothetical protein
MKRNLILYSCISLLLFACSKSKNSNNDPSNIWTFKGTTYTAGTVTYVNGGSVANLSASATGATATSADGLVFAFTPPPAANGQMLITNSNDANTVLVAVSNLSGTTTTFYINDVTNVHANVAINNSKLSVNFPGKIWLHNMTNYSDSAQLSVGTISQ